MDLPPSLETDLVDPDEAAILASFRALPTEDDLPCDDGEPLETPRHREQMNLLIDSLKVHWADRTRYFVGGNMFLHYDPENKRRSRGPDVFLVLDVGDRERKSWVVWQEGMRFPDVIIELLSDTTRAVDKGVKKDLYEGLFRTAEYYLYDPFSPRPTRPASRRQSSRRVSLAWRALLSGRSRSCCVPPPQRPARLEESPCPSGGRHTRPHQG